MIQLVAPHPKYQASWLEGTAEFEGAHRDGAGIEPHPFSELHVPANFHQFTDALVADALAETPRAPGFVPCTYLWIVEDNTFLGSLAIRHELNDFLFNEGGHIGYSVRPSARRKGHASHALGLSLPLAHELGIASALLTCDEDNRASQATIESQGGVYEDSRNGKRRYWIETSAG